MIKEHKTPVLFTPDEIRAWPPGLEINETLATISKGKSFRINIEIYNSTDHPILLNGRTVLGRVELVKSIAPFEVQLQEESRSHVKAKVKTDSASVSVDVKEGIADKVKEQNKDFLSQFDLSSLNDDQKSRVCNMLVEESDSFSKRQDDIGCDKDFQLLINLSDQTPVQKTYNAIPKPFYPEVKHYIEDLLNKGFITKSRSTIYSSPVVCERKKDGSLRLCVDYRQLNERTIPDRHPLPRIKDTLESLGGNRFFTLLDQGKAYHQGFVRKEHQHLTAFITPWGLYQWVRVPFGLSNAPGGFQRFMEGKIGIKCFSRILLVAHGRKPPKPRFYGPIRRRISEENKRNM